MQTYHFTINEIIAAVMPIACDGFFKASLRALMINALCGESERAIKLQLHINAYFTAADAFVKHPPESCKVEQQVYLAACETLGRLIEKDIAVEMQNTDERWALADLLSMLRLHLE